MRTATWREPIGIALGLMPMPPDTRWFLRDPIFAGLHDFEAASMGRSNRDTAHTCYPDYITGPADRRLATIVIPERPDGNQYDIDTTVHELGHIFDWMTGHERSCTPIGGYAARNREEAFAEAFTAWLLPDYPKRWSDAYRKFRSPMRLADVDPDDVAWMSAVLV